MKIPENFKQKYSLKGDSYPAANADAALSELFAVSGRLYKENADLKAEVARLREEAANAKSTSADAMDISGLEQTVAGLELTIGALEQKLDAIRIAVNDTLCVANDAVISAKKAEDSAKEAKAAAEEGKDASEDALDAAESALAEVRALGEKLESAPMTIPAVYPEGEIAEVEETEAEEKDDVLELLLADKVFEETENDPAPAEEVIPVPEIIGEEIAEPEPVEEVVDEPAIEIAEEPAEEPEEEEEIEVIPESEPEVEAEPEKDDGEAIADDLIRSAGLDSEPEAIEPAEPINEEDLSARLAKMYAETEDEELPIVNRDEPEPEPEHEEKHAPTSFTDMKSALDAIRARLKK